MDGVDAVLLALSGDSTRIIGHNASPLPNHLRSKLQRLSHPGQDNIDLMGECDREVALIFAETAQTLLSQCGVQNCDITAIGSHGQTIRHRPQQALPFSIQIGDPSTIAALTNITTVADFRRKDIACGGEGAPLAPGFHRHVFHHESRNRAIVNIGGIGNITWLPSKASEQQVIGFDTGPGNGLMDAWVAKHLNKSYDHLGTWAASGCPDQDLLALLMNDPYLHQAVPKSTGKELFNLDWLQQKLDIFNNPLPPEDIQATLCLFTAASIVQGLRQVSQGQELSEIYICGGGAFNTHLLALLKRDLNIPVETTDALGIHPLHVEGAAFAWMAHQTLNRLPASLRTVTGADRDAVLGGIYYP